jgi:hypothetical protein
VIDVALLAADSGAPEDSVLGPEGHGKSTQPEAAHIRGV